MQMTPKLKKTFIFRVVFFFGVVYFLGVVFIFGVVKVWKKNFPPYGSFGIGCTKTGIR